MNFNRNILVFSIFAFVHIFADPYNCTGTITINPPTNISDSYNYPSTWNSTQDTPQYAANQNCSWIFNVPKGMFAYFTLKVDTNNEPVLTLTDSVDYVTIITEPSPFFLMDPLFKVDLQATKNGFLGMTVTWFKVNQPNPKPMQVHPNGSPVAVFASDFDNGTLIQSDTRVNLLALPPTLIAPDVTPILRNTQLFDGPTINSTLLGNLYQVLVSGKSIVSSGKYLMIYSLLPGFGSTGNSVIVQDYFDVKDFKSYKAINCVSILNYCEFSLDARNGNAAAIRYSDEFYIKDVSLPETNVLSVYTSFVTPAHKLVDYTSTNSKTNTPQKIHGVFTTFVLNKDQGTVRLSNDKLSSEWSTGFNTRRGFFYSPNYTYNTTEQKFSDQISSSPSISNISYTVERGAIIGDATLNVVISSNKKTVIDTTYSVTNFPSGPVRANGDTIAVTYNPNGAITTGAFVSFGFDNSAATNGLLIGIIICIWRTIFN